MTTLLNLLQYCFCVMFWFFGCEACGILVPRPGIKPVPPALQGEILTTGLLRKSLNVLIGNYFNEWVLLEIITTIMNAEWRFFSNPITPSTLISWHSTMIKSFLFCINLNQCGLMECYLLGFNPLLLLYNIMLKCPRLHQWESFQVDVHVLWTCPHHSLITSILSGRRYFQLIVFFSCPTPGISHFSKQSWLL